MTAKRYKLLVIAASTAATAMCLFPLMSKIPYGSESCTLFVRGYNLMEFSAWGILPVIAPLLIPVVLFLPLSKRLQLTSFALILTGNAFCYGYSFTQARAWLDPLGSLPTSYYPCAILYPLVFVGTIILAGFCVTAKSKWASPLPRKLP